MTRRSRPRGITTLAFFFVFGTAMSGLAAVMLLFPGSALDVLWQLNPRAHQSFAVMRPWAVALMAIICLACAVAARGLWRCTPLGYWTATTILAINLIGDTVNAIAGHDWRTLIGLPIGGAMLAYLISQRRIFAHGSSPG